jgi:hypothetical protein
VEFQTHGMLLQVIQDSIHKMKIIKTGTHISVPYRLRKQIQHYVVEDKLHSQTFDPYNFTEGEVTKLEECICSQHYNINDKLYAENDLQFWVSRDNSWSWVTAGELLVGDYLLTDHGKTERINKLEHLDVVLEGYALTSDTNFFAEGYLVK